MRRAWAAALVAVLASCSDDTRPSTAPRDQQADLGGDVIARISGTGANDAVPKSVVPKVAAELKIPPADAAHKLVDDAVAAVAARDRGLDAKPPARWNLQSARGRMFIERLRADARAAGPPTDAEIQELSARHWREVDRPESARVDTVVVMRSETGNPEFDARAKALANELHAALADVKTREDWLARARAFPHPKEFKVQVDELPAITDDGWSIEGPGHFDETFSKAAVALQKPGDSVVVETKAFGWHVIRLLEKVPEQRMALDARRIAFTEEAYAVRAQKSLSEILKQLRTAKPVKIEPSAETLMRSVMTSDEQ